MNELTKYDREDIARGNLVEWALYHSYESARKVAYVVMLGLSHNAVACIGLDNLSAIVRLEAKGARIIGVRKG